MTFRSPLLDSTPDDPRQVTRERIRMVQAAYIGRDASAPAQVTQESPEFQELLDFLAPRDHAVTTEPYQPQS